MIQVEQLSFGFTAKDLYKDISFTLEAGQHCALIGSNGTGKSTLVEILIHPEDYLYDDIGSGLLISEVRRKRQELFESLSLYYKAVVLHEDMSELLDEEDT